MSDWVETPTQKMALAHETAFPWLPVLAVDGEIDQVDALTWAGTITGELADEPALLRPRPASAATRPMTATDADRRIMPSLRDAASEGGAGVPTVGPHGNRVE